jgi:meso-butanediol dehydrogenase/(S,S)-butanediol dehydrogenase/diacetyl reductase
VSLTGRIAVVTGAAGGLGAAVADRLAAEGAAVERIDLAGGGRRLDVRDAAAVAQAFGEIAAERGRIDVLVNCAGIREIVPVLELSAEEWQRVIDVNLGGTFHCSQAAARVIADAGGGSIVNVASTSALAADPSRTAYCASKAGILGLTRAMALDLGPRGVRVNAVCPGLVRTPLTEAYFADQAFVDGLADVTPLGRAADPAEVADVVAFLAGDGARHISGVALPVDGGFLAGKSWGGDAFTAPPPR